jgi:hypothetical protein
MKTTKHFSRDSRFPVHDLNPGPLEHEAGVAITLPQRPLQVSRCRALISEDNIKMDHMEILWDGVDWINLARGRNRWRVLMNTVIKLRVP